MTKNVPADLRGINCRFKEREMIIKLEFVCLHISGSIQTQHEHNASDIEREKKRAR